MASSNVALQDLLQKKYNIWSRMATKVASNDLASWPFEDVDTIFKQVRWSSCDNVPCGRDCNHNPCGREFNRHTNLYWFYLPIFGLMTVGNICLLLPVQVAGFVSLVIRRRFKMIWKELPKPTLTSWQWCWNNATCRYLKAPRQMVRESIDQRAALCVNKNGSFRVMKSGYTVMSHVWSQTMGWNGPKGFGLVELGVRRRGIHFDHFERFFYRCDTEWLWADVIAMPEVLEDIDSVEQEEVEKLRIDVINHLQDIYKRADKVVILDGITLQLETRSVVDVAVTMACGDWITRMWTYSEARLARKAFVRIRGGFMDLDDVVNYLRENCKDDQHRYYGLKRRMDFLRPSPKDEKITMKDIYQGCLDRYCEVEVDQARALSPLLGLTWEYGWTLQDGLAHMKRNFPEQEADLEAYCHYRGLTAPA